MIPARKPRRIGYMRVSTPDQRTDRQAIGLTDRCDKLYVEQVSAVARHREVFDRVLKQLRRGDSLVVWDLDRAFRSTVDAVTTAELLRQRGVALEIVKLQVDTTTPEGELFYTLLAAFAQFERRMLSRRTREGMEAARRRGAPIGRPRLLDERTARLLHKGITEDGWTIAQAALSAGVSRTTVSRAFERTGLVLPDPTT